MCTSRFQAWTVFMAQAQFRAQTKLGSVHLPSQRRQKWKSRLKISLFFPTTLFLIRQHRLAIANKLFAKQNLFQRIDSFASKNLNRSIKCQRNSLLSVPKKVRWCQIVANWKVTKFSGFRRKFFGGQSVLVRENAQRDRTLVVVGRYENVQLLSTSRRMGVPNTWNRCLFYLPMWSMHLSLLWDAYIVAKMSLILSESPGLSAECSMITIIGQW